MELSSRHSEQIFSCGEITLPAVNPGDKAEVPELRPFIVSNPDSKRDIFLTVSMTLRDPTPWADAGHEIGWFET